MDFFQVDCTKLENYLSIRDIKIWNLIVTEGENAPRKVEKEFGSRKEAEFRRFTDSIISTQKSNSPEMKFSEAHDWYHVRNEGVLETLVELVIPHECREKSDFLYLTAVIISNIAEAQIFADGNKRTAYLAGASFMSNVQFDKGMTGNIVIPVLDRDLRDMLQEVARKKSSTEDVYRFLHRGLRQKVIEQADEQGAI